MKTLVEMAKELGIVPRPNLTEKEWRFITQAVGNRLLQEKTGLPETDRHERERRAASANLPRHLYLSRAHKARHWPEGVPEKVAVLMQKETQKKVFVHAQNITDSMDRTAFIWHTAYDKDIPDPYRERFVLDLDLSSPKIADTLRKMDQFISKYGASFKVCNARTSNRSDTANVYMRQPITPQMAQDLYEAVAPCLCADNHDCLNGCEILQEGGQVLKGMKIGPEQSGEEAAVEMREETRDQLIRRDIPEALQPYVENYTRAWVEHSSLGEKSAAVQTMDLMYYAMGKEGQNPFRLRDYDGQPYHKEITVKPQSEGLWKRLFHRHKADSRTKIPRPTVNWRNPSLWRKVTFRSGDKVLFGYRMNVSRLTDEQKEVVRQGLQGMKIQFTERSATADNGDIHKGDLTFRLADEASIRLFQYRVLNERESSSQQPVSMSRAEYDQQQVNTQRQWEKSVQTFWKNPAEKTSVESVSAACMAQKRSSTH